MSLYRLTLSWFVAGLLLLPFRALATTVEAPEFDQLVGKADYIVRAVTKSVTSEWREKAGRRFIATKVELDVKEVIRGHPPSPLVLDMIGGRMGEEELVIEGAPRFQVGEENILFVRGNGRQFYPLVAIMHGVYPIFHDPKSGRELVVRSNGMPLYSERDVSLPMTKLSEVKVRNPRAMPITAAAFIGKIRAATPNSTTPARER